MIREFQFGSKNSLPAFDLSLGRRHKLNLPKGKGIHISRYTFNLYRRQYNYIALAVPSLLPL